MLVIERHRDAPSNIDMCPLLAGDDARDDDGDDEMALVSDTAACQQ